MTPINRLCRLAVLPFLLLATNLPAAAQSCIGDCNSNGSVTVDELLVGLNVALGHGEVTVCGAFEETSDGTVTIDELVEGVENALRGCPSSRLTKASSSVALSSMYVMSFGSIGASATGGQSLALGEGPLVPAAVGGGAGSGCVTLLCPFGGTEVRCCDAFGALTFEWSQCVLGDGTEVGGFYSVESLDEDPCSFLLPREPSAALAPPPGIHFVTTWSNYTQAAGDFLGNFVVFVADLVEEFVPFGAECSLILPSDPWPDALGFAIRGDGTRFLQGSIRTIAGTGPSILQDVSSTFGDFSGDVEVDVIIDEFSEVSCLVDTQIDGVLSSTDLLTGRAYTETYDGFIVEEATDFDGSFLVALEGTSQTDCAGQVGITTREPLRIFAGDFCPVAGELELFVVDQQAASTVSYTRGGGVEFDFGSDGTIDEVRFSCLDVAVDECAVEQVQGICSPCSEAGCGSGLVCAPCLFCEETVDQMRCAPPDDFAVCNDGVFGDLVF